MVIGVIEIERAFGEGWGRGGVNASMKCVGSLLSGSIIISRWWRESRMGFPFLCSLVSLNILIFCLFGLSLCVPRVRVEMDC